MRLLSVPEELRPNVSTMTAEDQKNSTHRGVVTLFTLSILHLVGVVLKRHSLRGHEGISAPVLSLEIQVHEDGQAAAHAGRRDQKTVTRIVSGGILRAIREARDSTSKVTET